MGRYRFVGEFKGSTTTRPSTEEFLDGLVPLHFAISVDEDQLDYPGARDDLDGKRVIVTIETVEGDDQRSAICGSTS